MAAYLVDHNLPHSLFAVYPELLAPVLRIIHRVIHTHLLKQIHLKGEEAASGAITLIQGFGSASRFRHRSRCAPTRSLGKDSNGSYGATRVTAWGRGRVKTEIQRA